MKKINERIPKEKFFLIALALVAFIITIFDAAYAQPPPPPGTGPGPAIPPGGPGTFTPPSEGTICGNSNCESNEDCAICPQDCGQCSQTAVTEPPPTSPPPTQQQCTESWTCTQWSNCTNGMQTRACTDSNNCNTYSNKPPETMTCTEEENITKITKTDTTNATDTNKTQNLSQPLITQPEPKEIEEKFEEKKSSFKNWKNNLIFILIFSIFIFLIITAIILGKKKIVEMKLSKETFGYSREFFQKLVDYIERNLKIGYDIEVIKRKLIEAGYDAAKIEKVIDYILRKGRI